LPRIAVRVANYSGNALDERIMRRTTVRRKSDTLVLKARFRGRFAFDSLSQKVSTCELSGEAIHRMNELISTLRGFPR